MLATFFIATGSALIASIIAGAVKGYALRSATANYTLGGATATMFASSLSTAQATAVMSALEAREGGSASTPAAAGRLEDVLVAAGVEKGAASVMAQDIRLVALPASASAGQVADVLWAIPRDTDRVNYISAMALRSGAAPTPVLLQRAGGRAA